MKKDKTELEKTDIPSQIAVKSRDLSLKIPRKLTYTTILEKVPKEITSHEESLEIFTSGDGENFRVHIKPRWSAIDG